MLVFFLIISLLLVIIFFLIGKTIATRKRVDAMTQALKQINDGESARQIFSQNKDELGTLALEINRLAEQSNTAKIKYEKEQLTKKQLISNLSHDVRTPLVSVIGYLEAIVEQRIEESQKEEYIATAYNKAILLKDQVNQLFEFVQSDANELRLVAEKMDVCETAKEILIAFLPVLERDHLELETKIPDTELWILADKSCFVHILENILKNTLTHAEEGKYLGVFIQEEADVIHIDIADKGQGIDGKDLPFVFERLYKADTSRTRGGGIGLAIARELTEKMGGTIEILRSIPGDTVFRLTFPQHS